MAGLYFAPAATRSLPGSCDGLSVFVFSSLTTVTRTRKRLTPSLDVASSQAIWKKQISHPLEFGNTAGYIIRTVPASQVPWTHFHDIRHFFYAIK